MNADIINLFIKGTKEGLESILNTTTKTLKVYLKNKPFENKINVTIMIKGDIKGIINYSSDITTVLMIVSKLMYRDVKELDDLSKSAFSEVCNMVSGRIATTFFDKGFNIDITPPVFSSDYSNCKEEKFICVPIELEDSKIFDVNIYVEG